MLNEMLQIPTLPDDRQVPSGKSRYAGKRMYQILFVIVFLLLTTVANAQTGKEILVRVDSVMNAPKDMTAIEKMTLTDKRKKTAIQKYIKKAVNGD